MTVGLLTKNPPLEHIAAVIRQHELDLRRRGITSVAVFGSRALGDHQPGSDLDVLIEVDQLQKFSLIDLSSAQFFLEDLFGCPVHITAKPNFKPTDRDGQPYEALVIY
jgi:uncharacterized protein